MNSESNRRPARSLDQYFETTLDRDARESETPDFEELAAYVEGTLDEVDREIVEDHLEADPALRAEVEELRALREGMRETTPAAPAEARPPARLALPTLPTPPAQSTLPAKRRGAGSGRSWMLLSGAIAATAIVGLTWVILSRSTTTPSVTNPTAPDIAGRPGLEPVPTPPPTTTPTPRTTTPAAIVVRDAGRVVTVDAAGQVSGLSDLPPATTQAVVQALTAGILPRAAALDGLRASDVNFMGADNRPRRLGVLAPVATVVREPRPTFRWSPHPGARAYTVTVFSERFEKVLSSPAVRETTWTATTALDPGAAYEWQVTADTPDGLVRAPSPPARDARFRIQDDASRVALERELTRAGSSHLLEGLALAQAGVLDEAERAFAALLAENPDSPRIKELLARVRERLVAGR
jgi:anti-sigma factor RsiW